MDEAANAVMSTIRAMAREALKETNLTPPEIAEEIAKALGAKELRAVAAPLILHEVQRVLHNERPSNAVQHREGRGEVEYKSSMSREQPGQLRYYVDGEWKLLSQMTIEDCRTVANDYYVRAEANSREGDRFAALAKLMEHEGVKVVGKLAKEKLAEVMS